MIESGLKVQVEGLVIIEVLLMSTELDSTLRSSGKESYRLLHPFFHFYFKTSKIFFEINSTIRLIPSSERISQFLLFGFCNARQRTAIVQSTARTRNKSQRGKQRFFYAVGFVNGAVSAMIFSFSLRQKFAGFILSLANKSQTQTPSLSTPSYLRILYHIFVSIISSSRFHLHCIRRCSKLFIRTIVFESSQRMAV